MRTFIAGGTGVIGSRLIPKLVSRGHSVFATTSRKEKLDTLRRLGAKALVMDGLDADAVGHAVARAEPDVIVHQMTALAGTPDMRHFDRWFATTNALRTAGTSHLLSAADAVGVKRFVAQSFCGWPSRRLGAKLTTERDPLDDEPLASQAETMRAIQFVEQAVLNAPLTGLVLRYGSLYGPGASDEMVEMVRRRRLPIVGRGRGVMSFIHADDAAEATAIAMERGDGGVYNIVDDDPAPQSEWLPAMAAALGAPPPRKVPVWLARLLAGEAVVRIMDEASGASNAKAKGELGWTPRWKSWRDGFREALVNEPRVVHAA
ncbi:MAG: NAD(P)-dependent oxidoreductase [Gemmatimonadota bacterium]|nr:NAD(P)-dependent oxidoreductase [Gemmatimonadota bacterium]